MCIKYTFADRYEPGQFWALRLSSWLSTCQTKKLFEDRLQNNSKTIRLGPRATADPAIAGQKI